MTKETLKYIATCSNERETASVQKLSCADVRTLISERAQLLNSLRETRMELNRWHEWRLQTSDTGYETSTGAETCARVLNNAADAIKNANT